MSFGEFDVLGRVFNPIGAGSILAATCAILPQLTSE